MGRAQAVTGQTEAERPPNKATGKMSSAETPPFILTFPWCPERPVREARAQGPGAGRVRAHWVRLCPSVCGEARPPHGKPHGQQPASSSGLASADLLQRMRPVHREHRS